MASNCNLTEHLIITKKAKTEARFINEKNRREKMCKLNCTSLKVGGFFYLKIVFLHLLSINCLWMKHQMSHLEMTFLKNHLE